jgi:hypothetical protein
LDVHVLAASRPGLYTGLSMHDLSRKFLTTKHSYIHSIHTASIELGALLKMPILGE